VSGSNRPDPAIAPTRGLRRLGHLPAVTTTYDSRDLDLGALDALAEAATRRGYDDGYAEGLAAAAADAARTREDASQRANTALAALAEAAAAVHDVQRELRADVERSVPKFAFALLEALVARDVQLSEHPARDAVMRALRLDDGTGPVTVRLHPTDVDAIGDLPTSREVSVIADAVVEPGGALVEVDCATLDGQLGSALERVRRVLFGAAAPGVDDDRAA
jgi:flagellar assembly protein FliH